MQVMKFLSLLPKRGLSYAIYEIYFSFSKTWSVICNFWKLFTFSKNVDYYMQFLEFISLSPKTLTIICDIYNFFPFAKNVDYHLKFMKILSLLRKRGPSYAISGTSITSPKTGT